jgi:hypothetical protein
MRFSVMRSRMRYQRPASKLTNLVEAQTPDRPIPLVSFVARQRDLRDLVGENLAGVVQVQFSDVLRHWEARFHRITLEDRNLPAIAEKRVLRPLSEAARQTLGNAFDEFQKVRPEVWNTLLTETADKEMFRKVYPFSPALVQTLIAVSAALQRERTALKLMLQLLVDRRDDRAGVVERSTLHRHRAAGPRRFHHARSARPLAGHCRCRPRQLSAGLADPRGRAGFDRGPSAAGCGPALDRAVLGRGA